MITNALRLINSTSCLPWNFLNHTCFKRESGDSFGSGTFLASKTMQESKAATSVGGQSDRILLKIISVIISSFWLPISHATLPFICTENIPLNCLITGTVQTDQVVRLTAYLNFRGLCSLILGELIFWLGTPHAVSNFLERANILTDSSHQQVACRKMFPGTDKK